MYQLQLYAEKYENLYIQPRYSLFHTIISCVTSQEVNFNTGRSIRKQLYKKCGFPLIIENVNKCDLTCIKGLTEGKRKLIEEIVENYEETLSDVELLEKYSKLRGIGEWTINAVSILLGLSEDINLSSDQYIRKNMSFYIGKQITNKEIFLLINQCENKTKVSYFLWRIKPTSIYKISQNIEMTKEDFV